MNLNGFIHQKSYEKIVLTLRRHPVTFLPYILLFLVLISVPVIFYRLILAMFPNMFSGAVGPLAILFFSLYSLSVLIFFYTQFVTFYLDMWVVTNDRLIDVRQTSLFARTVSEVDLYQIQDATSRVNGFFHSLFNYGDVTLQTAGPVPKFIIYNVHNPDKIRQIILDLSAEDSKHHNAK